MIAVALRSACFQAFGTSGAAATKSMIKSSAATRRGPAMLLAKGMKISAEPKPEKPRDVPDTSATAQIAIATLRLTSVGSRLAGFMRYDFGMMFPSCPEPAAGLFGHLGHDLRRHRFDLLIGKRLLARLDGHGNRDRFPGLVDALALVDVEHGHVSDQLPVDALRRAHDIARL